MYEVENLHRLVFTFAGDTSGVVLRLFLAANKGPSAIIQWQMSHLPD